MVKLKATIHTPFGLHTRPATKLVELASRYEADIKLQQDNTSINGKSILGVTSLGAMNNSIIIIVADGPDEKEAANAIKQYIEKLSH